MTIQTPDTRGPWDQRKAEAAAAGLAPVIPIRVESMPMLRIEGTLIVHRHIDPAEGALIEVQVDPEGDMVRRLLRALTSPELAPLALLARTLRDPAEIAAINRLAAHPAVQEATRLVLSPAQAEVLAQDLDEAGGEAEWCLAVDCPSFGDPALGGYCGPHAEW